MSNFCRAVKANRKGVGCGGHDSEVTNLKAGSVGHPFVQVCHAGVAEVIIPVFGESGHFATVLIGQAVTEEVEVGGTTEVLRRLKPLGVDENKVRAAFRKLPVMPEAELLGIGLLAEAAIRGVAGAMGIEAFEREFMLENCPPIRKALDIISRTDCWDISQTEIARQVCLDPTYFSRLFKKVMKKNFLEFMTRKRIHHATKLLHTTDLPVGKIALECGYSRQSYFTRRFREVTGMTPSQYRTNRKPLGQTPGQPNRGRQCTI